MLAEVYVCNETVFMDVYLHGQLIIITSNWKKLKTKSFGSNALPCLCRVTDITTVRLYNTEIY